MEYDNVQNKGKTGTMAGLKEAIRDPVVWLFAAMAHMHLAANGFKNFVSANFDILIHTSILGDIV